MPSEPQMSVTNLSISQNVGQQSSGTVVSTEPVVQNNPAPTIDPEKTKLIQQHLVLLLHAHKCQRRENQSNGEVRQCTLPHCRTMKHVLTHMLSCTAGKLCSVPHCSSSKQIIFHWKNCTRDDCPVCLPLKQASDRQQAAANVQINQSNQVPADMKRTYAALGLPFNAGNGNASINPMIQRSQNVTFPHVNDQASRCSSQNLNHVSTQTPGGLPNTAQNLNHVSTQTAGDLPYHPTVVKDWHQSISQELRHHLIQKIVQSIFPMTDIISIHDSRIINLVAYAEKVEGDMYSSADSKEAYYQLLAENIYRMQKELEEKRQKRKELQMQQQQVGGPNLAPVLGNSAAEASSELLISSAMSQLHLSGLVGSASQQQMSSPNVAIQTNSALQQGPNPSSRSFTN